MSTKEKNKIRQRKHRAKVAMSPTLHAAAVQKRHDNYERKHEEELLVRLRSEFIKAFDLAKNNNSLSKGICFIVPDVLRISIPYILTLKQQLGVQNKRWGRLHQLVRYYMPQAAKSSLHPDFQIITSVIDKIFNKSVRLDNSSWHTHSFRFLKHTPELTQEQGFHVDIKEHYMRMLGMSRDDHNNLTFDNFGGYSIFAGLDKVNTLVVGEANENTSVIENKRTIEFPFKIILVISSFLPHERNKFQGKETVFSKRGIDSLFSLKGFLSVNDYGVETMDLQGWFREGRTPFCDVR